MSLLYTPPPEENEDGEPILEPVDETFGVMIGNARDFLAENPLTMAYDSEETMTQTYQL